MQLHSCSTSTLTLTFVLSQPNNSFITFAFSVPYNPYLRTAYTNSDAFLLSLLFISTIYVSLSLLVSLLLPIPNKSNVSIID